MTASWACREVVLPFAGGLGPPARRGLAAAAVPHVGERERASASGWSRPVTVDDTDEPSADGSDVVGTASQRSIELVVERGRLSNCLEGRFAQGVKLLFSCSEPVYSSSGYSSMSPGSAPVWHAADTGHAPRCELRARLRTPSSSAGNQRGLRSCMRAVVRPRCCTFCCTELTLTINVRAIGPQTRHPVFPVKQLGEENPTRAAQSQLPLMDAAETSLCRPSDRLILSVR